jgi:hypothetical protein
LNPVFLPKFAWGALLLLFIVLAPSIFSQGGLGNPSHSTAVNSKSIQALSTPSGSCFPSGPRNITNSTTWINLQCQHIGNLTFLDNSSLTMINSSLIENGNETGNETFGSLTLTGNSSLNLEGSILNLNVTGRLQISGNSNLKLSESEIINSNFSAYNNATLTAGNDSILNVNALTAYNLTNFVFNSAFVSCTENCAGVSILANKLSISSTQFLVEDARVYISALNTTILNSRLQFFNSSKVLIESSAASSNMLISQSIINETDLTTGNLSIASSAGLTITGSHIFNQISALGNANGTLDLVGGSTTIISSNLISSTQGFYGYSSQTFSALSITSNSNLRIVNSQLTAGQTAAYGVYFTSRLKLSAFGNISLDSSHLQSESLHSANISILTTVPSTSPHFITLNQTMLETHNSPGNVTIFSNYGILMNSSKIDANSSGLSVATYQFLAYNSNLTGTLKFGGSSIGSGSLYNTSTYGISGSPFSDYGWFYGHVVSFNSSCPNCGNGAKVVLIDPATGAADYTATTNSSGWIAIPVLLNQSTSTGKTNFPYYLVEASGGGLRSSQVAVNTRLITMATIPIGDDSTFNSTCTYNSIMTVERCDTNGLNYAGFQLQFTYVRPSGYLGILSNAYPLSLTNNASNSEVDFNTVGSSGYTFNFSLFYAKNFTSVTPTIRVDGSTIRSVVEQVNATYDVDTFSIPSGNHLITFSYLSPAGYYVFQVYPQFYPSFETILIVILLAIIGSAFIIYYVKTTDKRGEVVTPSKSP